MRTMFNRVNPAVVKVVQYTGGRPSVVGGRETNELSLQAWTPVA